MYGYEHFYLLEHNDEYKKLVMQKAVIEEQMAKMLSEEIWKRALEEMKKRREVKTWLDKLES